jgi:hypothetical protein
MFATKEADCLKDPKVRVVAKSRAFLTKFKRNPIWVSSYGVEKSFFGKGLLHPNDSVINSTLHNFCLE